MWNWINSYYDKALSCLCKGLQQQQLTSWVGQWNAGAALEPEWREAWWWCTWSPEPTTLQPKRQHGQHEPCMVSPITTALFVSLSLTLLGWIGNIGGLVNPRLEKMTWCITEAQHCCTPKLRYDECAFVAHDTDIYCIISKEKHTGRFFFFFLTEPSQVFLHLVPYLPAATFPVMSDLVVLSLLTKFPALPQSANHHLPVHLCLIPLIIHLVLYIISLTTAHICQTVWCATQP